MSFGIETADGIVYLESAEESDVKDEKAQIAAAFLSVFGSEGEGERKGTEWKWIVSPAPGLHLIIYIEKDDQDRWDILEPSTCSRDSDENLRELLICLISQLRDVWVADPHPALKLFFGDFNLREVK